MVACSCKLVPYKFSRFYFCERLLICKIHKIKVPQKNLYAYGILSVCSCTIYVTFWLCSHSFKAEELVRVYPRFVNFFEISKETLHRCDKQYPRFHAFLKANESKPECARQTIEDLLITPVQRLPRIILLLQGRVRHVPSLRIRTYVDIVIHTYVRMYVCAYLHTYICMYIGAEGNFHSTSSQLE